MFRVPAVPIMGSTLLQLTVTGITYITLDREMYGQPLKWTLPYISRSNVRYVVPVTVNCSNVLPMMGTAGTRNM
jgi:hypothetical protein